MMPAWNEVLLPLALAFDWMIENPLSVGFAAAAALAWAYLSSYEKQ
jgi:hypothetical protein